MTARATREQNKFNSMSGIKMPPPKNGKFYIETYLFKSINYPYISFIYVDDIEFWHAQIQDIPPGSLYHYHFYSDTEERCAKEVYKIIKRYIKKVTKSCKISGGHFIKYKNWQKWIENYEKIHSQL